MKVRVPFTLTLTFPGGATFKDEVLMSGDVPEAEVEEMLRFSLHAIFETAREAGKWPLRSE